MTRSTATASDRSMVSGTAQRLACPPSIVCLLLLPGANLIKINIMVLQPCKDLNEALTETMSEEVNDWMWVGRQAGEFSGLCSGTK
mmetsp:Transcript_32078/g.72063  ORF Transcript_32078/g.72063 Transcript_32078/m.72063 type:complete len:86 (+) Transcript_32078:222-479(+)